MNTKTCPACGTLLGVNPEDGQLGCPHIACCYTGPPPDSLTGKIIEWVTEPTATRPRTRHIAEVMEDPGVGMLELYPGKRFLARSAADLTIVGP